MKRSLTAFVPFLFAIAVAAVALGAPRGAEAVAVEGVFRCLPLVVYALVFALGGPSHQTRCSFLAVLLAACTLILDRAEFGMGDAHGSSDGCLLLISLVLPVNFALFYSLPERGMFTFPGLRRLALVIGQAAVLFLVTLPPRASMDGYALSWLLTPLSESVPITWLSLLLFINAVVILCIPRGQAGETSGPIIAASLLSAFAMLSFRFPIWDPDVRRFVLLAFSLSAGMGLAYSVIDGLWVSAFQDGLTGMPNRRALRLRFSRLTPPFALAMVDIDHFKKINDTYGHDTGDQVLRFISGKLRSVPQGAVYRYGGEEFALVFGGKSATEVKPRLSELRARIEADPFILRAGDRPRKPRKKNVRRRGRKAGRQIPVTVSIGVAQDRPGRAVPDDVLRSADKALYQAKKRGRNRVIVSSR